MIVTPARSARRARRSRLAPALVASALLALVGFSCTPNDQPLPGEEGEPDAAFQLCGNARVEGTEQCDTGTDTQDCVACKLTCGDGTVQAHEACDTGIASGPGACPSSCADTDACTSDVLSGEGCQAKCLNTEITATTPDDGCCPDGANANSDNDCDAECGNGALEPGELCDTAIAAGAGACVTDCADDVACTTDSLLGGGTCQARCEHANITQPKNGDGCCPPAPTPATTTTARCRAAMAW